MNSVLKWSHYTKTNVQVKNIKKSYDLITFLLLNLNKKCVSFSLQNTECFDLQELFDLFPLKFLTKLALS